MHQILLEQQELNIDSLTFPLLIHGKSNSGASFFSLVLMAQLHKLGHKIVFFSALPIARESFLLEVDDEVDSILIEKLEDLDKAINKNVIFIKSGDINLFNKVVKKIKHKDEYYVFIKNIENYDADILTGVKDHSKLILAGDTDECSFNKDIAANSQIYFSKPKSDEIKLPAFEQYHGVLLSGSLNGEITIEG